MPSQYKNFKKGKKTMPRKSREFSSLVDEKALDVSDEEKKLAPISVTDIEEFYRLKAMVRGKSTDKSIYPSLIKLSQKGYNQPLFLLAEVLVQGKLCKVDKAAAYQLAYFARLLTPDPASKKTINQFIRKYQLPVGGKVTFPAIETLLNKLKPVIFNQKGEQWEWLKACKRREFQGKSINVKKGLYLNEDDKDKKSDLATYFKLMNAYLDCQDLSELPTLEENIENHFRDLLIEDALWNPCEYYSRCSDEQSLAAEKAFQKKSKQLREMVFVEIEREKVERGPFRERETSAEAEQLRCDTLSQPLVINLNGRDRINPILLAFCEQGDPEALFLLAESACRGEGGVRDLVSAYFLARLAREHGIDLEFRKKIDSFIVKNRLHDYADDKPHPDFPQINGLNPRVLFEDYQYYRESMWRELRANNERRASALEPSLNQPVVSYLFVLAQSAWDQSAWLSAYCFAMAAYLNGGDAQVNEEIQLFLRGKFVLILAFHLKDPENGIIGLSKNPCAQFILPCLKQVFSAFDAEIKKIEPTVSSGEMEKEGETTSASSSSSSSSSSGSIVHIVPSKNLKDLKPIFNLAIGYFIVCLNKGKQVAQNAYLTQKLRELIFNLEVFYHSEELMYGVQDCIQKYSECFQEFQQMKSLFEQLYGFGTLYDNLLVEMFPEKIKKPSFNGITTKGSGGEDFNDVMDKFQRRVEIAFKEEEKKYIKKVRDCSIGVFEEKAKKTNASASIQLTIQTIKTCMLNIQELEKREVRKSKKLKENTSEAIRELVMLQAVLEEASQPTVKKNAIPFFKSLAWPIKSENPVQSRFYQELLGETDRLLCSFEITDEHTVGVVRAELQQKKEKQSTSVAMGQRQFAL